MTVAHKQPLPAEAVSLTSVWEELRTRRDEAAKELRAAQGTINALLSALGALGFEASEEGLEFWLNELYSASVEESDDPFTD